MDREGKEGRECGGEGKIGERWRDRFTGREMDIQEEVGTQKKRN